MNLLENIETAIQDFVYEKGRLFIAVLGILVILFFTALIMVLFQFSHPTTKKVVLNPEETFTPDQNVLIPESVIFKDGYYLSRPKNLKWDEEETENWFITPDDDKIKELNKSNDSLVTDILGAVP
ncbi:MAG: hypothetical protein K6F69_00085 [Treponema sp.]|nr:hypothetical protein [Treponema sp.]